jgi:hypothetical protein
VFSDRPPQHRTASPGPLVDQEDKKHLIGDELEPYRTMGQTMQPRSQPRKYILLGMETVLAGMLGFSETSQLPVQKVPRFSIFPL